MFRTIAFTLTLIAATNAGAAVLRGTVTAKPDGAPVAQAYVLVRQSGKIQSELRPAVDKAGNFSVEVQPGFYDVFVTAVGFSPTCTKIGVTPQKPAVYNPRLEMSRIESSETHK